MRYTRAPWWVSSMLWMAVGIVFLTVAVFAAVIWLIGEVLNVLIFSWQQLRGKNASR